MDPRTLTLMRAALGSARAARALLADAGSIRRALETGGNELAARYGVSTSRVAAWEAMRALRASALAEDAARRVPLSTPRAVHRAISPLFEECRRERFYVLPVDAKLQPLRPAVLVGEGGPDFVAVAPRRVFEVLLREDAAGAFLAHNHPSGDPSPSAEDRRLTRRLGQLGEALGVRILDHLVVGDGRAVSILGGVSLPSGANLPMRPDDVS